MDDGILGKEHILTKEKIRQRKIKINCDHCSSISLKGVSGGKGGGEGGGGWAGHDMLFDLPVVLNRVCNFV